MNQEEKKKFKPVNPEIVMLKVQQALIDTPDSKWIEITGFRRCRISTSVQFERGIPFLNDSQTHDSKKKPEEIFKEWIITKLYIPSDSIIEVIDLSKKRDDMITYGYYSMGQLESICAIKLPRESYVDVVVRGFTDRELVVKTKNHVLGHLNSMYKMFPVGDKDFRIGLTNKNWKVLKNDVSFDGMIKLFNGSPRTRYVYSSAWNKPKDATIDKFHLDVKGLLEVEKK